jgi:hypothetical protein
MKKINYFLCLIATSILLFGCSISNVSYFYQVYETRPISDNISISNNCISYEDKDCIVLYNFWQEYGTSGFTFNNKTDSMIYLDLSETFFIDNGIAYDYFKNRTITNSSSVTTSNSSSSDILPYSKYENMVFSNSSSNSTTNGTAVSTQEQKIICVPPKSSRFIKGYNLLSLLYNNDSLIQYPKSKDILSHKNRIEFTSINNSPLDFKIFISYSFNKDCGNSKKIQNEFYINSITNYDNQGFCIEKVDKDNTVIHIDKPTNFFIGYKRLSEFKENPFSF